MALAIIGGDPARFSVLADLHRRTLVTSGFDVAKVHLAVHAHGFIGDELDDAADDYFPSYAKAMTRIGRERGWGPMTREAFDMMRSPGGSLVLGDVETVATKIAWMRDVLGIQRFMLHISVGSLPHDKVLRSIELLGTEVAPLLRS